MPHPRRTALASILLHTAVLALLALPPASIPATEFEWAFRAGGEGNDKIRGAAAGDHGAVFVTGEISGLADFGDKRLQTVGKLDFVVAKIDSRGKVLWASRSGGAEIDRGYGVSPAPDGGCYATGHFQSPSIAFGAAVLTNAGDYDGFVVRYDAQGSPVWARRFGGKKYDYGHGIATLPDGSPVVAGALAGPGDVFGSRTANAAGRSAILARLTPSGKPTWSRIIHAPSASGHNVATGPDGSIALCGYTRGAAVWPDGAGSESRLQDIFVAKFDKSGKLLWRKDGGGAADGLATSVAIDRTDGAVVIAGMFKATAKFGPESFTSRGGHDFYMTTYAADGSFLAAHHGGGAETDYALGAAARPDGGFAITGELSTVGEFNGRKHATAGTRDAILATLDSAGAVSSFALAGGTDHDLSYAIAGTTDNAVVISGAFRKETRLGAHTLTAKSGNDIFVAKARIRPGADE